MPNLHVHVHDHRQRDAGTAHDPKSGQFTSSAAAGSAKLAYGMPDHVVKGVISGLHPEDNTKRALTFSVRGRWKQNMAQHHRVTIEPDTGRILAHQRLKESAYHTVMGERSKLGSEGEISPKQSMRHGSVHAAIQEYIKEHKK